MYILFAHFIKNYVAKVAKTSSNRAMPALKERYIKLGFPLNYLEETLKYIRDRAPLTINFRLELLDNFIKDGKYKNCFEINKIENLGGG